MKKFGRFLSGALAAMIAFTNVPVANAMSYDSFEHNYQMSVSGSTDLDGNAVIDTDIDLSDFSNMRSGNYDYQTGKYHSNSARLSTNDYCKYQ